MNHPGNAASSPLEPILRPAGLEDLRTILAWVPTLDLLRFWGGPAVDFPPEADRIWRTIEAEGSNTFVLVDREAGILGLGQTLAREPGAVHLARIIVSPAHRGRGLGGMLCRALLACAVNRLGAVRATLNVYTDNLPAVACYRALGFTDVPERSRAGCWFMMKDLQA